MYADDVEWKIIETILAYTQGLQNLALLLSNTLCVKCLNIDGCSGVTLTEKLTKLCYERMRSVY